MSRISPKTPGWARGRRWEVFACGLAVLMLFSVPACAHKIDVHAGVEGKRVLVEAYSEGKAPLPNSSVTVFDGAGHKLLEGRTNDRGQFSFDATPVGSDLRIVLDDGMGHRGEYTLEAGELPDDWGAAPGATERHEEITHSEAETIRIIVEEVVEEKLQPMEKMLKASRFSGPSATEIIGGIGYIVGIAGMIMYFKAKRHKGNDSHDSTEVR